MLKAIEESRKEYIFWNQKDNFKFWLDLLMNDCE